MYKYRAPSCVSNTHKMEYRQSTFAEMKDNNTKISQNINTMTGCICTERRHLYQINTNRNIDKAHLHKGKKKYKNIIEY